MNPRAKAGYRNLPFITRPCQDKAIDAIKDAIEGGHDLLINKSRDEGATFLVLGMFLLYFVLVEESLFLCGSRIEDLVDKLGNQKALFYKLDYMFKKLPLCIRPPVERTHLHLANLMLNSAIDGESTNENFGAGDRRLAVMLDEFGRVQHKIAQGIRESLSDTTDCVIYNSTHWYGQGHPFNRLLRSGKIEVFTLPWEKNPIKNKGIYRSPEINIIEIKDIDYYRTKYPGCFEKIKAFQPFVLSELEKELLTHPAAHDLTFVADGGESNNSRWRSVWYDAQCKRRDKRDIAQNIDRDPVGAGDAFFDNSVLDRIRTDTIKPPKYKGEVQFKLDEYGKIKQTDFVSDAGRRRLKWWGPLMLDAQKKLRPNQAHNYIVACDVSLGVGQSNSTAGIYDVNTNDEVGMFACPNSPPESFADQTIAICKWVGGASRKAFLIWEANGPGGSFEKRVRWHGYSFVYTQADERISYRPKSRRNGWYSNRETKYDALLELRIALNEGLKTKPQHKALKIYDLDGLKELQDYIFYENGDIGPSEAIEENAGAKSAHGDRVVSKALYVVALSEQPKAAAREQAKMAVDSFAWRRYRHLENKKKKRDLWHE